MINYSIPGWMSNEELLWLHETSKQMQSVLEIGSFMGKSTYALCTGCKGPVFAVDKFKVPPGIGYVLFTNLGIVGAWQKDIVTEFYDEFYKNVGRFENLVTYRMGSVEAAKFFKPKSIDMIFIDGDHTKEGVTTDINAWLPVCNKLICGHDLRPPDPTNTLPGMKGEVEEALKELNIDYKMAVDSIWKYEII